MAKAKILIVDDDRVLAQTTAEILRQHGYEVMTVFDSYQAVQIVHEVKLDLVILDVRMPAGGGAYVYDTLRHSYATQNIPVIFTTGMSKEEVKEKIAMLDEKNVITKPYEIDCLLERIKQLVGA